MTAAAARLSAYIGLAVAADRVGIVPPVLRRPADQRQGDCRTAGHRPHIRYARRAAEGDQRFQRCVAVILPGALPSVLVGLRFSLGIMWLTLIVAETIGLLRHRLPFPWCIARASHSPSMPMEIAPEPFAFAFAGRMTAALGFRRLAFSAAIGPAMPRWSPPRRMLPRISHQRSDRYSSVFLASGRNGAGRLRPELFEKWPGIDAPIMSVGESNVHAVKTHGTDRENADTFRCTGSIRLHSSPPSER